MSKNVSRLYESFQPTHYDLNLHLDTTTNKVLGTVTITGRKTGRPSQRLTFHGLNLKVNQATVVKHDKKAGDQPVEIARVNLQKTLNEIRLHSNDMMYAGEYTITIVFESTIQSTMHGIYRSTYHLNGEDDKTIVSTQFESHHAREAFPCIDEPEAKATFDLTLITPQGETVISNMPARQQSDTAGETGNVTETVFETSPRMSTYLLAFVVGDMQRKTVNTKDGVAVSVYATKAHDPTALDFALETTKRCIEFFNEYYGVPYPLPKCDMVAIPDFSSAAMENWGLVTYREPYILADPQTASQSSRELIALVICHELSHQWFGNLVTMKWWDDLWLNESFANVMEYVAADALFPEWHIFNTFVAQEGLAAFRRDSIAGVQSVRTEVRHPDEISTLFDPSIVYAKGGRLLNMLRAYIGEEAFRAGLTEYFNKHKYSNTTGNDLWAALAATSGKDVAAFMTPWLERPGFPLVTADQQDQKLTVSQTHFVTDPTKADGSRYWSVPLLATGTEVAALLDKPELTVNLKNNGFIRLNRHAVGHYLVKYANPVHMEWVANQAQTKELDEAERLMLLSDSAMLARNGSDSLATTLKLLAYYTDEDSEPVWDMLALVIADSRRFIDSSTVAGDGAEKESENKLEEAIKALIRTIIEHQYQRLGWDIKDGELSQDTKLRATVLGLGSYAEHPAIKARALELFEAYKQDASAVDSELRGIIFTSAIRYEAPGAFDYLLDMEQTTTNPDLKQELIGSLSATRDPERGAQLLARLKDLKLVRLHDVDHWVVLLLRNRYNQQQTWDWLRDNWQWIETTFAGDKSYDSFPRYVASAFNTAKRLEEYKAFFEPKVSQPILTRNITMGIEELSNRISWVNRDLDAVKQYFNV